MELERGRALERRVFRDALAHGDDEVMRGHDVDLAIEHGRVIQQIRDEKDPEHVVVVPFEGRSRVVAVLVRRKELVEGASVHATSERRLEFRSTRVDEVDPGENPGGSIAHRQIVVRRMFTPCSSRPASQIVEPDSPAV
jgi:hypothetical protein